MKCFTMETTPDGKRFLCQITETAMDTYFKHTPIRTTWNILYARIFNLEFANFLRMVRDIYGATLAGKEKGYIYFYFEDKSNCQRFIKELEKRFDLWKKL